jgi:hypothetical protein
MSTHDPFAVERNAYAVDSLQNESDERAYWLSKTPHERLEAMELMRQVVYGYGETAPGLQRFFEVAEL